MHKNFKQKTNKNRSENSVQGFRIVQKLTNVNYFYTKM